MKMNDEVSRSKEWAELHSSLTTVLGRHGKIDPYGEGDFWLVDDDWGSAQHKVECAASAVTQALVLDVQALLSNYAPRWEVIFAVPAEPGRERAFLISANSMVDLQGAAE